VRRMRTSDELCRALPIMLPVELSNAYPFRFWAVLAICCIVNKHVADCINLIHNNNNDNDNGDADFWKHFARARINFVPPLSFPCHTVSEHVCGMSPDRYAESRKRVIILLNLVLDSPCGLQ
jgi:hypothetical protein